MGSTIRRKARISSLAGCTYRLIPLRPCTLPLFITNDPNSPTAIADGNDFESPVPMLTEGNRTLWQALVGYTDKTTMISVFIDDDPNHQSHNRRTWYDGVGYRCSIDASHTLTTEQQEAILTFADRFLLGKDVSTDIFDEPFGPAPPAMVPWSEPGPGN